MAKSGITVHWAEQALESLLPDADLERLQLHPEEYTAPLGLVAAHACVFVLLALFGLWWRDPSGKG